MTDVVRPVPPALGALVQQWDSHGRPAQAGSNWSLRAWKLTFPEHAEFLASLPNPMSRDGAAKACSEAHLGSEAAVRGFLAAMIWGYGRIGYGPYRTSHVLTETHGAAGILAEAAIRVRNRGGPAAFDFLAQHRLHGLGVAFATKYLFFCTSAAGDGPPALILDRLVRGWLARNTGWSLRLDWHIADYRDYVENVAVWASELNCAPSDLEYLMFGSAVSSDPTSQWFEMPSAAIEPRATSPSSLSTEEMAVLEALHDAADAFSALPLSAPSADAEDFDRGIRQLRRIVLARSHTMF